MKIVIGVVSLLAVVAVVTTLVLVLPRGKEETPESAPVAQEPTKAPETENEPPSVPQNDLTPYSVGVGIADMTGPPVEINFMGYAELSQSGAGIHTRQFSRAYIIHNENTRVVLVVADVQAVGIAVRREVVKNLQELYGNIYSLRNVIIAGTHTHSAPGGHLVEFILDVSILGFSSETYQAYVDGITRSIVRAHNSIVPARLFFSQAEVTSAHINRSPFAYDNNPAEERARFSSNTDNTLTQLRIEKADGSLHGVINWFAVHTTSMNNSNHLISSDNMGYAALRMEKTLNPGSLSGQGDVVVAFTPSNMGDISPNTEGARCEISGNPCDNQFDICDILERCFASGPGSDMFESTKTIGTHIYDGAMTALNSPGEELTQGLAVVHQFVDMSEEVVPRYDPITRSFDTGCVGACLTGDNSCLRDDMIYNMWNKLNNLFEQSEPVNGCVPALGYSFASGTIDGANTLNITQGTISGNPLIDAVAHFITGATDEDHECHAPKPILLATGRTNFPFPWHPRVISVSLLNLGGLIVAGVPGEPTTMAGRRIRDVIQNVMEQQLRDPKVVVSGLVNEYIHYVATYEEYQIQRYEAASTIYGPHTLNILLSKFSEFTRAALDGVNVEAGTEPLDNRDHTISLILPVLMDVSPVGRSFGDVLLQPPPVVPRGTVVRANFVAANPRNDLKQESSHLLVERQFQGQWIVVARDADWETKFIWDRTFVLFGNSRVTIEWDVPLDAIAGSYRIRYFGAARTILGAVTQFEGTTNTFQVDS